MEIQMINSKEFDEAKNILQDISISLESSEYNNSCLNLVSTVARLNETKMYTLKLMDLFSKMFFELNEFEEKYTVKKKNERLENICGKTE